MKIRLLLLGGLGGVVIAAAQPLTFNANERLLLLDLEAQEKSHASMVFAARMGQCAPLKAELLRLRAEPLAEFPEVDGLYVRIPLENAATALALPQVERAQLTGAFSATNADGAETGKAEAADVPRTMLGRDNIFSAQRETQTLAFKDAHPTYDGRGTTLGAMEAAFPYVPSLSWAMDLKGNRVPKLVDYLLHPPADCFIGNALPAADEPAGSFPVLARWSAEVKRQEGGLVVFGERAYLLPEGAKGAELRMARSVNRATRTEVTALWDVARRKLWLLADRDTDFRRAKEESIEDNRTTVREVLRFADDGRKTDPLWMVGGVREDGRVISLLLKFSRHGDVCASVAVGHTFFGSEAEAAAPGGRLIHHLQQQIAPGAMELPAFVAAMRAMLDPRVDVFTCSTTMRSIYASNNARNTFVLLCERAIARRGVPVFSAVGNGGAFTSHSDYIARTSGVITVGAYLPNRAWRALYGYEPSTFDAATGYSSYGPTDEGRMHPEILAPMGELTSPDIGDQYKNTVDGIYLSGGTSSSTPNAAGHTLLLLSAARQAGVKHDLARLRAALFTGCRFLPTTEARIQGHGLIQVANSWSALQRLDNYELPDLRIEAPVRAADEAGMVSKRMGSALFEPIGWFPGQQADRAIRITRRDKAGPPARYQLRWKGQTANFTSTLREVILAPGQSVEIPVRIAVRQSGAYSAILDLIDPIPQIIVGSVLSTVFVADEMTAATGHQVVFRRELQRPGDSAVYLHVPPGLGALRLRLDREGDAEIRIMAQTQRWHFVDREDAPSWGGDLVSPPLYITPSSARQIDMVYPNPEPGVWQIWLSEAPPDKKGRLVAPSDAPLWLKPMPFTLTATGYAAEAASPRADEPALVFKGVAGSLPRAVVKPVGLGSAREETVRLKPGDLAVSFEVDVPAGSARFEAGIEADAGDRSHLTLAIMKVPPTHKPQYLGAFTAIVRQNLLPGATKRLTIPTPSPGRYRVIIDPVHVPDGGVSLSYRDQFVHPVFGKLEMGDQPATLEPGVSRRAMPDIKVMARPTGDRHLVAQAGLFSSELMQRRAKPDPSAKEPDVSEAPLTLITWRVP